MEQAAGARNTGTGEGERPRRCLARAILGAFDGHPALEAVTVDPERRLVEVATLGRTDLAGLRARVEASLQEARDLRPDPGCAILAGNGNCSTCGQPLPAEQREQFQILQNGRAITIRRVTCPTAPTFWRWRRWPLPRLIQRDADVSDLEEHLGEWRWQLLASVLCGLFTAAAVAGEKLGLSGPGTHGLYLLAYLAGGWFAVEEAWERLRRQGGLDVHFLMLAVAVGSAAVGQWNEGAILLFLFSLAGALEHYALERTHREVRSLFHSAPKTATVVDPEGREREVAVEEIRPGMRLLVRPGAQFAVDGEVVRGQSAADESNLTGESVPVAKGPGDLVLAGTLNLWGALEVTALRPAAESSLQKIIRLIREAQQQKAPAQRFTERFGALYTYGVLGLTVTMYFVWWLGLGLAPFRAPEGADPGQSAFYRTMTLLVVSSPCALVLSIPSAILAAIAWAARHGILFRGGAAVEKLAEITLVALDKTGTLTTGELRVDRVESHPPGRESEVAALACSVERWSQHPLARALSRYAKQQNLALCEVSRFESVTGQGVKAWYNGHPVWVGRREWIQSEQGGGTGLPVDWTAMPETPGQVVVWVHGNGLWGRIWLRDEIRPEAGELVARLRGAGLRAVVLTGDRQAAAEHLRRTLGLEEIRAELRPEQKVEAIRAWTASGERVAMVGDGVNDAPSLAAAHVGVAMGARGADAALEQADVVLMHDRLENFLRAYELSRRARRIIRQNLAVSLGTVAVLVVFALLGKIPLPVGVIGHEGSTVVVVMNSLRLLFQSR
ncbi:heavy metal translocating P-type ATPase [Limisphaera sp. VF-2]|jgi:Cd2+/Zn2+-exporting ATPase|uniref:heavy metal translocating P-type ATPase n=1 Tax=Limisphaera sp. VF-2 TaxID=3400418 RepID=UPI0017690B26